MHNDAGIGSECPGTTEHQNSRPGEMDMRNPDGIKFEEFALAVNEFQRWNDVIKEVKASREEARGAVIGYMNAFGYRASKWEATGSHWKRRPERR